MIKRLWQILFPRRVWLTFDDGPHPELTPKVLDTLKRHGIKATFFLQGDRSEASPHLAARIHAESHAIGNHTFSHPHLNDLTRDEIAGEVERTRKLIAETTPKHLDTFITRLKTSQPTEFKTL